jgi:isopenicillin-N epimerase
LRYFDRDLLPHLVYSARRLAYFCQASRDDFTLIPNVTYGLNTILRGYQATYQENSHVILWDTSYGSLKKMAHKYCQQRVTEIPVSDNFDQCWNDVSESSSDIFERAFLETLKQMKINNQQIDNALLIIDHTTSNTALNMPIKKISKLAKELNMLVMVDGAHGLLAQDLALNEKELPHVDFYVGNGHKWLSCPRGIGFLYCPHAHLRDSILEQPAVISHGIGQGFQSRFLWDGCRDYAAALSVPVVLDHWEQQMKVDSGTASLRNKINNRLKEATKLLSQRWHGNRDWERSLLAPLELHSPMMALVRLPNAIQSSPSTSGHAKVVQDYLYDNFIEVPIKCVRGVLYARISCHVYNEIHEYQRLADVMLKFPKPW